MTFHEEQLPSLRSSEPSRLTAKGWEVYPVADGLYEVAYDGYLQACIEHGGDGAWYAEEIYDAEDPELYEVKYIKVTDGLPSLEAAAMAIRAISGLPD
ncbi:hypothetical protein SMD44_05107 [Streptomyces alboflavus]|uniref:Uncharacterized protein n=1 Tax=Streptomyces alboflavus TaxID=67267 RepID=A0A1Z1WGT9_9ACTN|nr:hypothetical protein [Streptomyces alboflavus]ARX85643.1 hypothetical protein SMD44_05107 [Streptomyces alboflavus]